MKMPDARDRAESESLDMLVDFGRVCLRRRRMHAAGGSKSELAGVGFDGGDLVAEADVSVAMVDLSSSPFSFFVSLFALFDRYVRYCKVTCLIYLCTSITFTVY